MGWEKFQQMCIWSWVDIELLRCAFKWFDYVYDFMKACEIAKYIKERKILPVQAVSDSSTITN